MAEYWRSGSTSQRSSGFEASRTTYPQVAHPVGSFGSDGSGTGGSFYPRVAQPVGAGVRAPAPVAMPQQGGGPLIKVTVRPAYRVAPAVQLSPQLAEVPHSSFQFDFELERKILAEAEQQGLGEPSYREFPTANGAPPSHMPAQTMGFPPPREDDSAVSKYLAMGLQREAVVLALATHGDLQPKVMEFCSSYDLLREMGFAPEAISGALAMYDNDRERALAHLAP